MVKTLLLRQYSVKCISFTDLLVKFILPNAERDCRTYGAVGKRDVTADRLIKHHTIFQVCEYLLANKDLTTPVIYLHSGELELVELPECLKEVCPDITSIAAQTIKMCKKFLPIRLVVGAVSFENLSSVAPQASTDRHQIRLEANRDLSDYTFDKAARLPGRKVLPFLTGTYFGQLRTRALAAL